MPTFVRRQEIEHPIGASGRFSLNVTASDVVLEAVDGEIARVEIELEVSAANEANADELFERVKFRVQQDEGALAVSEPKRGEVGVASIARIFGIGNVTAEANIHAFVPANAHVIFEGVSGDVTGEGFQGTQEYRTVSGDLWLEHLGGDLRVRGVSSDISIRADAAMRLEANTVSGDLSAFAPRFELVRVVTVSGDVELEGQLGAGTEHRVETVSGDLSLGLSGGMILEVRGLSSDVAITLPHRAEGSRDRRRYVVGDGAGTMLFSSMSGDVVARGSRRFDTTPTPPTPPTAPTPPTPPTPPTAPALSEKEQLEVLRALEDGEIDVDEAARRLTGGQTDG